MKTLSNLMSVILVIMIMTVAANAQDKNVQPDKKQNKQEIKDIEKNAKTEAKKWKKDGYTNPIGTQPLEMQFEKAWKMQAEQLEDGQSKYIVETGSATGETAAAAKMQAVQSARLSIAENISSEVAMLVNNIISNAGINTEDATSVTKTMSKSKSLVAQSLGRTITLVEATKSEGKNVNYNVRLAYDFNTAKEIAKNILRKKLEEDTKLMKETINMVTDF